MASLSRRTFLVTAGAVGAGIVLVACGSDDSGASIPTADVGSASGTGDANRPNRVLVRFAADGVLAAGMPQRIAVGLADADGLLLVDTAPQITLQVVTEDGKPVGAPLTVDRHAQDLPRPYYPVLTNIADPGTYGLVGTVDGVQVSTAFSILEPDKVPVPKPGDQMVPVDTPTTANSQGVNPICTREPECDLHELALTDALKAGKPVAFLIATPAYCQTAACGPVLDVLLGQQSAFGGKVEMVHAEVYTDSSLKSTTRAVDDYHLSFEPVLFLAGADGVIQARLDSIFDTKELNEALTKLTS
ncbi:MAG TPA: twin-arginine translocation signal domain-containing protein [Acidimicrobiales bacterium]|nr:twin-arginine translocation signal domain-containing protein [Acidimicrobiales bacterium]